MLVILGTIDVNPEDMAKAVELANVVCAKTKSENGCRVYAFSVDTLEPGRLRITEWWESEADLQAHLRAPHVAEFGAALGALRVLGSDAKQYAVSGVGPVAIPDM